MKRRYNYFPLILFSILLLIFTNCKKDNPEPTPEPDTGKLIIKFDHRVDNQEVQYDTMKYVNAAGEQYMINEIQYFISDVTLYNHDGSVFTINDWVDIYYVDVDIPSTLTWNVYDKIPTGTWDSISFTFGIPGSKNKPYMFVNPPESYMFWPHYLGGDNGGYHYLKLNGKWLDDTGFVAPYNFHLGVGQIYDANDSIIGFVQNFFRVSLPSSAFNLKKDETKTIQLVMNIENWFQNPNIFDFDYYGGYTMQNEDAMEAMKENGHDVFSVGYIQ